MPRLGLATVFVLSASGAAAAQGIPQHESVRRGSAPDAERRGIRTGPVVTYLSVGVRGRYNDNIYAQRSDPKADYIAHIRPRVQVRTRHRRHGAKATLKADAARHLRHPAADVVDFSGRVEAHLDVGSTTRLGVKLAAQRKHEDPASPDAPGGEVRTPIRHYTARLEAETQLGRLGANVAGSLERRNYRDVTAGDGSRDPDNDDRDRSSARVAARLSYGLSAIYEPFIQGAYHLVDHDQGGDADHFDRDSHGITVSLGARYRPNGFTVAEVRAGYRKQRTADARIGPIEGLTAEIALRSNLTPRTTLDVSAQRLLRRTTARNAAGFFATRGEARLDHRPWGNFVLGADANLARHSFVSANTGSQRKDTRFGAGVDARYDPSPFLRLTADYRYTRRVSTSDAAFTRNQVTMGAEVRY